MLFSDASENFVFSVGHKFNSSAFVVDLQLDGNGHSSEIVTSPSLGLDPWTQPVSNRSG